MSRAIGRVEFQGEDRWVARAADRLVLLPQRWQTTHDLLRSGPARIEAGPELEPAHLRWLSPITAPCQVVCQGLNYTDHRRETGAAQPGRPAYNTFFTKAASSLAAGVGVIRVPAGVELLDYELELGLVIGEPVRADTRLSEANWTSYVAGLVVANDLSARDIQIPQGQWFKGKSYRGFCPIGPWLVLLDSDDWGRLDDLHLHLEVNGETRQEAYAADMLFSPAETLVELATLMDLHPGDVVLTGTPGGVALKAPPEWLQRAAMLLPEETRKRLFLRSQRRSRRYLQQGDEIVARIHTDDRALDLGTQRLVLE